jgi:predicted Rdx family selenoprotein
VLYVELLKALYGCIKSALLWYKLFTSTLVEMGFELNPYDACVANKMINEKQCTVCWFVNDVKISHEKASVVKKIISTIEKKYGKMVVTYGNKHTYVGMDIDYTGNGEAKIIMNGYIKEALQAFPEDCTKAAKTPGGTHLFEIDENCAKIYEKNRKILHSIVAKLLFVTKRARPDISVPISFLTSRVTKADEDDWKKLKRLLEYLHGTIDMPLTFCPSTI